MTAGGAGPAPCEDVARALPELALGILAGRERAVVLAHVEQCPGCGTELEQLSLTADALLRTAPEIEPPVGFEVRLLDRPGVPAVARAGRSGRPARLGRLGRLGRWGRLGPPGQIGRPVRTVTAAAAAVVALAAGVGIGWATLPGSAPIRAPGGQPEPAGELAAATLTAGGQDRGRVTTYAGTPAWLFMTVHDAGITGNVACRVTLADGTTVTIGTFWLSHGYGSWGSPLPATVDRVRRATVVSTNGTVLAAARLP
jgi:hypothetical protein